MWYTRRTPDGVLLARFDNAKDAMLFEQGVAYIEQTDSRPVAIGFPSPGKLIEFDTAKTVHGEMLLFYVNGAWDEDKLTPMEAAAKYPPDKFKWKPIRSQVQ